MFIKDRLVTSIRALSSSFFNKGGKMPINKNKGSTYFRVGSQKQLILATIEGWGKGNTIESPLGIPPGNPFESKPYSM